MENDKKVSRGEERRIDRRLPIRVLVEYESIDDFLIDYTANVSIGGMFIQTRDPLEVGTRFNLRLRIPDRAKPVETVGEVCWVLTPEDAGPMQPGMGIQFQELEGEDQRAVEKLLAEWK